MSEQPDVPTLDAVETFVASLRQRAVPLNTIKSYAHDLQLFVQAMPADLTLVTSEQIQAFLTSEERHSAPTRRRRYSTLLYAEVDQATIKHDLLGYQRRKGGRR